MQKTKQKGDNDQLNKAVKKGNDDLSKCQKSNAACDVGKKMVSGDLKKCQGHNSNCQKQVDDLKKLVNNGKKDDVAHDECKAKVKKFEDDLLKNSGELVSDIYIIMSRLFSS